MLQRIAIIGAGPAGLFAAETLATAGLPVTVYERMPRVARKLLLAGRGGLNLTHSEPLERFLARYRPVAPQLRAAITAFPPDALRAWCEGLGQETFVGTSGRVFPRAMKTSPLLRAWLERLARLGVEIETGHRWIGWDGRTLTFETPQGAVAVTPRATILAAGGASWPRLGSDGEWMAALAREGIAVAPLAPSNCGVEIAWSGIFRTRFAGQPLKRIAVSAGGETVRGEAMITGHGLEGGAIYAASAPIREQIAAHGAAAIRIDLRPDETEAAIAARLQRPRGKQSLATYLRKALSLDPQAVALLQEAAFAAGTPLAALAPDALAAAVKGVPLTATGLAPLARAISTAGGVRFDEVDDTLMLRRRPGVFVAGEMLDWDAPTGGYLLQACFATGRAAALGVVAYVAAEAASQA